MLNIINNLSIFFEDCYREVGVREYAKLMNISPPTSSKQLKELGKQGLLKSQELRNLILFRANRNNQILKDLSRIYWRMKLSELIEFLKEEFYDSTIILFGSLVKLETTKDSDIDLAVISSNKKNVNFKKFEKKLNRKIQTFYFSSTQKIPEELKKSVVNGFILEGKII